MLLYIPTLPSPYDSFGSCRSMCGLVQGSCDVLHCEKASRRSRICMPLKSWQYVKDAHREKALNKQDSLYILSASSWYDHNIETLHFIQSRHIEIPCISSKQILRTYSLIPSFCRMWVWTSSALKGPQWWQCLFLHLKLLMSIFRILQPPCHLLESTGKSSVTFDYAESHCKKYNQCYISKWNTILCNAAPFNAKIHWYDLLAPASTTEATTLI